MSDARSGFLRAAHGSPRSLVLAGFEGTTLAEARPLLEEVRPGGVVLFARNVSSLEQTKGLVADLHAYDPDLLVAIDQEGGSVDRLRPHVPSLPSALALGTTGRPDLTLRAGELTGALLAELGVDVDFAPVLDLALAAEDNAIGTRSFAHDPERVSSHAGAFLAGLESEGVLGCLKHFPGLGGAVADSHATLPVIPLTRTDLEVGELAVYRTLLPSAGAVLVSHGYYPHLTRRAALPATLSEEVSTLLLRGELGFGGTAFSDDLVMGALAAEEIGRAAVRALSAGSDLLLVCEGSARIARVAEAVEEAVASGRVTAVRLREAVGRLETLRARGRALRTAALAPALENSPHARRRAARQPLARLLEEMRALAREVAERSVVATRRAGSREQLQGPVVVLRPRVKWLSDECARPEGSPFVAALREAGLEAREQAYTSERAVEELRPLLEADPPAAFLLATADAQRKPLVVHAVRLLAARAPVHHVALTWPDDLGGEPLAASVSSLGCGWESVAAAVRALAGTWNPRAKLLT